LKKNLLGILLKENLRMTNLLIFCSVSLVMSVIAFLVIAAYIKTHVKIIPMTADQAEQEATNLLYEINK